MHYFIGVVKLWTQDSLKPFLTYVDIKLLHSTKYIYFYWLFTDKRLDMFIPVHQQAARKKERRYAYISILYEELFRW